ncbi:DUF6252 family protein (plasmid) [Fibrella sp. ES10-3-2-2]
MNKFHSLLIISLIGSLGLFSGCATDPEPFDPLPKESQSGQRIIGCRINGEVWKPYREFRWDLKGSNTDRLARYSAKSKTLWVIGLNETSGQLEFSLVNVTGPGKYTLDNSSSNMRLPVANGGCFSAGPAYYLSENEHYTDSTNQGEVVVTKLADGIVAGRFSFKAINKITGKVVNVTDGRFDFYYLPGIGD